MYIMLNNGFLGTLQKLCRLSVTEIFGNPFVLFGNTGLVGVKMWSLFIGVTPLTNVSQNPHINMALRA
jgi:hypothetical protein